MRWDFLPSFPNGESIFDDLPSFSLIIFYLGFKLRTFIVLEKLWNIFYQWQVEQYILVSLIFFYKYLSLRINSLISCLKRSCYVISNVNSKSLWPVFFWFRTDIASEPSASINFNKIWSHRLTLSSIGLSATVPISNYVNTLININIV